MAIRTGNRGIALSPPTMAAAMGARKNMCIKYMPNESRAISLIIFGDFVCRMQVKRRKAPKVAHSTFGVQNSNAHSNIGVSMSCPGTPFIQNDQAVAG